MKELYDHLEEYGLVRQGQLAKALLSLSERQLTRFFTEYREKAKKGTLRDIAPAGVMDLFPDSWDEAFPLKTIKQLALYVNTLYIHDPFLASVDEFDGLHANFQNVIRHAKKRDRLNAFRTEFLKTLTFVLALRPFSEAGIVRIVPTGLLHDKREPGAVYAHDMYGPQGQLQSDGSLKVPQLVLPPAFAEYVRNHVRLHDAHYQDGQLYVSPTDGVSMGNAFAVKFDGDRHSKVYLLAQIGVDRERLDNAGKRVMTMAFKFKRDAAQNEGTFQNWVIGESQQYVRERINRLTQDLSLAAKANARFITTQPASADLAGLCLGESPTNEPVVNALLSLRLPYFDDVSIKALAKARSDEAAFADFQVAIDKAFAEVAKLAPSEAQARADEICREIIRAPLARIDREMKILKRNDWITAVPLAGSLLASVVVAGPTLVGYACGAPLPGAALASVLGSAGLVGATSLIMRAFKEQQDAKDKIRALPSYFYWKTTEATRKSRR